MPGFNKKTGGKTPPGGWYGAYNDSSDCPDAAYEGTNYNQPDRGEKRGPGGQSSSGSKSDSK